MQYGYDVTGENAEELHIAAHDEARRFARDAWTIDHVEIHASARVRTTDGQVLSYLGECTASLSPLAVTPDERDHCGSAHPHDPHTHAATPLSRPRRCYGTTVRQGVTCMHLSQPD